ncbi:MAG TPA: ROK family protein [Atribacter sp.]|uniref:N-acetylglucosamine repressor n=1 Tax=Candidatus Atribacter allofermentans TaxID=1852833 RepID=A0A1V5T2L0_9BACT|nr:ROK family protein [Atribacter sp.]MDD3713438.1 ROK family protein [Atribacterota bacterium]OQA60996.1 MAG: N-acetylglucosamine repressor [Candidatus Atribacteria bacterium ADurb.Bin276]HHT10499.1 ROK family protein [Candidatus Atribacteria bacterium]HQK82733.1 ROK family protein [Atribacter sp.]
MPRKKNNSVRSYYKSLVKNLVRTDGPISRIALNKLTGMRPASITDVTKELLKEGIIKEIGYESSKRGRRKVLLDINRDAGRVVTLDFNSNRILGLGADLKLGICYRSRRIIPNYSGKDEIIKIMKDILHEIIESPPVKIAPVLGIGIADPGIVNENTGISILTTQMKGWENVPIKDIMESEFGYPSFLESDTRCRLIAEKHLGAGKMKNDILMVELSSGIGAGMMSEGKLFRGSRGSAGELGHMMILENGPYCNCGSRGCLEAIASSRAITRKLQEAIKSGATSSLSKVSHGDISKIDINMISQAAEDGDKLSLQIIEEAGRFIGEAIANAINLLNPEIVILTGDLLSFGDYILNPIEGMVRRQALSYNTKDVRIVLAEVGEEAAAIGMAAVVLDKVFHTPELRHQGENGAQ